MLGEVLNEKNTREKIREFIDQALTLNSFAWGYCEEHGSTVRVEIPDVKKRVDSLVLLLEQAEGKPSAGEAAGTTIIVERPAR